MRRYCALFLVLVTAACAATPSPGPANRGEPRLLPLTPGSLGRSLSLSQLVTGTFDGRTYRMRFEVDITPERLAIVALSPLGLTLFTLVQEDGKPVTVTRGRQRTGFEPRHILFDLHLTYWPRKPLQAALSSFSMRLDDSANGSVRKVQDSNGKAVAEINYGPKAATPGTIVIQHFDVPYRLRIRSSEVRTRERGKGKSF